MSVLDDADDLIAAALALGKTQAEAGSAAGVSYKTVQRRLLLPEFQDRIRHFRRQAVERTVGLLAAAAADAVAILALTTGDDGAELPVRVNAARIILQQLRGQVADSDLAEDVRKLREEIGKLSGGNPEGPQGSGPLQDGSSQPQPSSGGIESTSSDRPPIASQPPPEVPK